jgi:D-alanine-D-alanine ligase
MQDQQPKHDNDNNNNNNDIYVVVVHGDPSKPKKTFQDQQERSLQQDKLKRAIQKISSPSSKPHTPPSSSSSSSSSPSPFRHLHFSFLCNHDTLIPDLTRLKSQGKVDLVFQLCDDGWQNRFRMEPHVCALLEMLSLNYTGSGPVCLGIAMDKQIQLHVAAGLGIPTPKTVHISNEKNGLDITGLDFPVFVKPNSTDGSVGITKKSVCYNERDVREAVQQIRDVFHVNGAVLVQEYLEGKDVTCLIIGNPPNEHTILPITEEDYTTVPEGWPKILSFESKWEKQSPYYGIKTVSTTLDKKTQDFIMDCSRQMFQRIGIRDYARFDWRLDSKGQAHFLEGMLIKIHLFYVRPKYQSTHFIMAYLPIFVA